MNKSVGKVNAYDDDIGSGETAALNAIDPWMTVADAREKKDAVKLQRRDGKEEKQKLEQGESSGSSTDSDIGDVLNCLRSPREVVMKCRAACPKVKKEDDALCKQADEYFFDRYFEDDDLESSSFGDYFMATAKPVRVPVIHVKDCLHEDQQRVTTSQDPATIKWCYCEDEGTSEEEDYLEKPFYRGRFEEENSLGVIKYSVPRQVDTFEERGAFSWDKIRLEGDLQDILNCMLPPLVYRIDGQIWIKEVSPEPARRSEVVKLVEVIEMKMEDGQGKQYGVDPVRRQIYDQLFDELIRQETIACAETGLLLLRLRDEMKMTRAAWESLLDHANNFSVKHIQSTGQTLSPLYDEIDVLVKEMENAEQQRLEFWAEQYLNKLEDKKRGEHMNNNRKIEIAPLQTRNKILKEQIRTLNSFNDEGRSHYS